MAEPISIQQLKDASEDAITLADFIYKPANVMIPRRLASDINSLQYYLDYMSSYAQHSYETYDEMVANAPNLPNGVSAFVTNDLDTAKNGIYTYNGTSFVKGDYQPENVAKDYVEAKLGGLQVFDGKVRAQDVSTSDGSTQEEVNKKTVFEYDTVADMVADTTIISGKVVSINGYHAKQDGGGAKYIISNVATDYSIPLDNGLHAVFNDTFNIRKFGIRDSATLNQSVELLRMRNYADDREYEIDFHNFSIMNPEFASQKKGLPYDTLTLPFHKPHKIKNVKFFNDKTKQLRWQTCPISFLPKEIGNGETFELDNVTFDPYVADYLLHPTSGDGDGGIHGFYAGWHGDFNVAWPLNQQIESGYSLKYNNINFTSPAISYNLSCNLRCENITTTNIFGEYWGLYIWHWCNALYAENVHGVFRDDLHTGSGRLLVTNLFQEEQEVHDLVYTQESQEFKNISCVKKTDGSAHVCVKRQRMGTPTLRSFIADNVKGTIEWFFGSASDTYDALGGIINAQIQNHNYELLLWCNVETLTLSDSSLRSYINSYQRYTFGDVLLDNVVVNNYVFYGGTINKLKAVDCAITSRQGLVGGGTAVFGEVEIINPTITNGALFIGNLKDSIIVKGGVIKDNYFSRLINIANARDDGLATVATVEHMTFKVSGGDGNFLIRSEDNKPIKASAMFNSFVFPPVFEVGTGGTLDIGFNAPVLSKSQYHAFPVIAAGATQQVDVYLGGAEVGDLVSVAITAPLLGSTLWAEVVAQNNVRVYRRNSTATEIAAVEGDLKLKVL